eukprot:6191322-Pleurochrysis_carterae.AAC.2
MDQRTWDDSSHGVFLRRPIVLLRSARAQAVHAGEQTPVFFGSAMNNFGVQLFLDAFMEMGAAPTARAIESGEEFVSGAVEEASARSLTKCRSRVLNYDMMRKVSDIPLLSHTRTFALAHPLIPAPAH